MKQQLQKLKDEIIRMSETAIAFWRDRLLPWLKALTFWKAVAILVTAAGAAIILLAFLFLVLSFGLPTVESLKDYKPLPGTTIYAADGRVLGRITVEKGVHVPLARVPKFLIDAVLATEDPRFYQHHGLD
ncbi:MAG TPA: transglycosylase domain-containing protein, partial [Nitrospirota bacterium]|nr:transglycosylase domain-containing protein [Nitrospirota bacterium]